MHATTTHERTVVAWREEDAPKLPFERAQPVAQRVERIAHVARHNEHIVLISAPVDGLTPAQVAIRVHMQVTRRKHAQGGSRLGGV
jgi:hypothetical protein